ncbi:MAG: hypothetical protein ACO3Q4_01060 [Ilumatobacteraceae bacterium]
MSRMSTRRRMAAGVLTVGLFVGVVACGGDDSSSSDLSRDDLLAILEAARVDRAVVQSFDDDELQDLVDQLLEGLGDLPAPETTVSENPDVTAAETPAEPATDTSDAPDTGESAPDEPNQPEESTAPESGGAPFPSVVLTLPGVSIPLGNLLEFASTLGVEGVTFSDSGGTRTYSITVTENGFGNVDITNVKVTWIVDGVQTPIQASKQSDLSSTKSVWTARTEAGPARMTITVIDEDGDSAGKSFIFNS